MAKPGMVNVRIKLTPGDPPRPATGKVFIAKNKSRGYNKPLEPYEVVAMPEPMAQQLLAKLPYELEMTLDKPTRPLYFADQEKAIMTSAEFNPATYGRSQEAKQAVAEQREQMRLEEQRLEQLAQREAELAEREAKLAHREATIESESIDEYVDEDVQGSDEKHTEDYEEPFDEDDIVIGDEISDEEVLEEHGAATNNAMTDAELKEIRRKAAEEAEEDAPEGPKPTRRRRRKRR